MTAPSPYMQTAYDTYTGRHTQTHSEELINTHIHTFLKLPCTPAILYRAVAGIRPTQKTAMHQPRAKPQAGYSTVP